MWPSPGGNNDNNNNNKRLSCSPSKSFSSMPSSLSPSPFSHYSPPSTVPNPSSSTPPKSMEEVWKDINLASLQDQPTTTITKNTPAMLLQDFLARPLSKDPPTKVLSSTEPSSGVVTNFFDSLEPPPATLLSLNSGTDFQYLENGVAVRPNPQLHGHGSVGRLSFGSCLNSPSFDALGSSSVIPSICKKRPQENGYNSGDPRHKRKIKNRESAARSRARKQAYTNELELEVEHLQKENAKLRRQQEKLLSAPAQLPKNNSLYRTSTAPF